MSHQGRLVSSLVSPHIFNKNRLVACLHQICYTFAINSMKAVCYIIAIVIAGLALYPCNDANICVDDRKYSNAIVDANDHDHSRNEMDLCTPFCTCNCCCVHVQVPATITYDLRQEIPTSPMNSYTSLFINRLTPSIWQPPKVA